MKITHSYSEIDIHIEYNNQQYLRSEEFRTYEGSDEIESTVRWYMKKGDYHQLKAQKSAALELIYTNLGLN